MPWSDRSSSQKRLRPAARSRMMRIVHLPQTISAVAQTGQVLDFVASAMWFLSQRVPQDFSY
jgi:hypothetical protein